MLAAAFSHRFCQERHRFPSKVRSLSEGPADGRASRELGEEAGNFQAKDKIKPSKLGLVAFVSIAARWLLGGGLLLQAWGPQYSGCRAQPCIAATGTLCWRPSSIVGVRDGGIL